MEPTEQEIFLWLGMVATAFSYLVSIAIVVLGIVVVQPINKTAGRIFAAAGGSRLVGLLLQLALNFARPENSSMNVATIFRGLSTLLWLITATVFYGGVMLGAVKFVMTTRNDQPRQVRDG